MLKRIFAFILFALAIFIVVYAIIISAAVRIFIWWIGTVLLIGSLVAKLPEGKKYKRPSDRR